MRLPQPVPGLVIRYAYLWQAEHQRGQEEGVKDRPCAVILVTTDDEGDQVVTVLPVRIRHPSIHPLRLKFRMQQSSDLGWTMSGRGLF